LTICRSAGGEGSSGAGWFSGPPRGASRTGWSGTTWTPRWARSSWKSWRARSHRTSRTARISRLTSMPQF